jgi:DNA-binding beta-propeller fold protein YncE
MRNALSLAAVAAALAAPAALAASSGPAIRDAQCISPARGCSHAQAVSQPTGIALAGGTVYVRNGVGSRGSLGVFARNARTSRLGQIQCVARRARPCVDGRGLETPSAVAGSPDGRSVYVTAATGRSVGVYARARTGKLSARGSVAGIGHPHAVAVSPDGRNVYVGGDRLWTFRRASSGALVLAGSVAQQVTAVAVSPDGSMVYAAGGGGRHGTLVSYAREPDTGALTADVQLDETTAQGLEQPAQLVALRDSVYLVSTVSGAVTRFDTTLHPLAIQRGYPAAFGLAVTAKYVYVAYRSGIGVLSRQLARQSTVRLKGATGVATAGRSVYAVSPGRITAFTRVRG